MENPGVGSKTFKLVFEDKPFHMKEYNKGPLGPQGPQGEEGEPEFIAAKPSPRTCAMVINADIQKGKKLFGLETDDISDGWHTFGDLYKFRLMYNALAFNLLYEQDRLTNIFKRNSFVHKSWKHYDGEWCFGEEKKWFIVVAVLDGKPISNHYKAEHWDLFKVPEMEKSTVEFDGHTSHDVIDRIFNFINK